MTKNRIYKIASIIFIIDQLIKFFVDKCVVVGTRKVVIKNFFSIYYLKNTGAAFSILENNSLLLVIISIFILIFFYFNIRKENSFKKILIFSYGFILGGILGNLVDRLFRHAVIDYLSFNFSNYYFPVFNVADVFIVLGISILIIDIFNTRSC